MPAYSGHKHKGRPRVVSTAGSGSVDRLRAAATGRALPPTRAVRQAGGRSERGRTYGAPLPKRGRVSPRKVVSSADKPSKSKRARQLELYGPRWPDLVRVVQLAGALQSSNEKAGVRMLLTGTEAWLSEGLRDAKPVEDHLRRLKSCAVWAGLKPYRIRPNDLPQTAGGNSVPAQAGSKSASSSPREHVVLSPTTDESTVAPVVPPGVDSGHITASNDPTDPAFRRWAEVGVTRRTVLRSGLVTPSRRILLRRYVSQRSLQYLLEDEPDGRYVIDRSLIDETEVPEPNVRVGDIVMYVGATAGSRQRMLWAPMRVIAVVPGERQATVWALADTLLDTGEPEHAPYVPVSTLSPRRRTSVESLLGPGEPASPYQRRLLASSFGHP